MSLRRVDKLLAIFIVLLILFAVIFFSWFALREFNHGISDGFDHTIYRQLVWSTLHGRLLWCSLIGADGATDLMMHTNLTLLFLLPVTKFFNFPEVFLVIHAFFLAIAAWPVYLIAKEKINRRAGILFAIFYLTNTFTIQALIEGFQTRSLSVPIFFLAFYLLIKKRYFWFNLALVILCFTHEINCLVVFMLGIYVIFSQRRLKHGLLISFLSLGWFILVIKVIFSHFGNSVPLETLGFIGHRRVLSSASEIVSFCFLHPIAVLRGCLSTAKLDYFLRLFLPLGFLSLASPGELAIGLPIFLQNFLLSQRLLGVQTPRYTMTLLPFIFISAIYANAYLSGKLKSRWGYILVLVIVCWSLSVQRFIRDPEYNPRFMQISAPISKNELIHRQALKMAIRLVPKSVSVSADLRALPFLVNRFELYDIPVHIFDTEYILIDQKEPSISPRVGMPEKEYLRMVDQLLISPDYTVVENLDGIILLKKGK
ncbi:MAG: DUF2079 domain-containing protein [Candidatus Omnitrophica bacterium]|nr:DUF2079 domain-containing protein [Candidatus Omnitrophota bacterium]